MLRIVVEMSGMDADAQGLKEKLAMDLERYGDVRVVEVQEIDGNQQLRMEG